MQRRFETQGRVSLPLQDLRRSLGPAVARPWRRRVLSAEAKWPEPIQITPRLCNANAELDLPLKHGLIGNFLVYVMFNFSDTAREPFQIVFDDIEQWSSLLSHLFFFFFVPPPRKRDFRKLKTIV